MRDTLLLLPDADRRRSFVRLGPIRRIGAVAIR
jgi:hypothetical protein